MKALTILQPWASLIACGAKKIETRSWPTSYRGPIAIHAGKGEQYLDLCAEEPFFSAMVDEVENYNPGCVIAIADLVDCQKIIGRVSLKIADQKRVKAVLENQAIVIGDEYEFGDYTPGRFALILENVRRIEPVPAKGMQRLWNWEEG